MRRLAKEADPSLLAASIHNHFPFCYKPLTYIPVCGTHALAGAVRSSLRYPRFMDVLKGGPTVTLHVEAFGNAVSNLFQFPC